MRGAGCAGNMTRARIRFAEAEDIACLADIERAAAKRFLPYLTWLDVSPELLEGLVPPKFLREAQTENRLWVATVGERVVGFVVTKYLVESCFVVELDVHPDYCRRGIGSALLETCCAGAYMHGFEKMLLTTFRRVPWNVPFYQKLGFSVLPPERWSREIQAIVRHEARYGFAKEKRVVMARSLTAC